MLPGQWPEKSNRLGALPMLVAVALVATTAAAAPLARALQAAPEDHGARRPMPLGGAPLRGATGLRLVVADIPPFVLHLDSRRVMPLRGVPAARLAPVVVVGIGAEAAVLGVSSTKSTKIYAVRGPRRDVTYLGTGRHVWPASDGRAVWIQAHVGRSECALRQVELDGGVIRAPQPSPCATLTTPTVGSLGLMVHARRVIDPVTGGTVIETPLDIVAVADEKLVLADGRRQELRLLDAATGAQVPLKWPSILWGLDAAAVAPSGRYVALAFADPAWNFGSRQALDVWLLDTETAELTQLPGMPAFVSLKRTSMAWTHDGRLVLLAQGSGKDMVAVWRPGQSLAVKSVRLPDRSDGGSDSFAVIR